MQLRSFLLGAAGDMADLPDAKLFMLMGMHGVTDTNNKHHMPWCMPHNTTAG